MQNCLRYPFVKNARASCLFFVSQKKKGSFKVALRFPLADSLKDLIPKCPRGIAFNIVSVSMERDGCQLQWPSQYQRPWTAVGSCVCAQIPSCLFSHDKLVFCFSINDCLPVTIWLHKIKFCLKGSFNKLKHLSNCPTMFQSNNKLLKPSNSLFYWEGSSSTVQYLKLVTKLPLHPLIQQCTWVMLQVLTHKMKNTLQKSLTSSTINT